MNERCTVTEEILQQHLDCELDALSELVLREHLKTCAPCRKRLAALQSLDACLHQAMQAPVEPPAAAMEVMLASILDEAGAHDEVDAGAIGIKAYLRIQQGVLARTVGYLDYLPGVRQAKSVARQVGRQSAGWSASFLARRLRAAAARG